MIAYLYLACFISGLLFAVRVMFFGAERRRPAAKPRTPLRKSEAFGVALVLIFGVTGYAVTSRSALSTLMVLVIAFSAAVLGALALTALAVATANVQPDHDPDDPRFALQGHVAVVVAEIPAGGEGQIRYTVNETASTVRARGLGNEVLAVGEDVCIERIEDGVAHVEPWALVEQRL